MEAAVAKANAAVDALAKAPRNGMAKRDLVVALSALKKHGRDAFLHLDAQRSLVRDRRNELDGHILGLQNLLYEREHLLRNIRLCREFTTPQLEQLEADGEVVSNVTTTATAEDHRRNLIALEEERAERMRLGEQIKGLREELRRRDGEASATRRFLDTLPDQLKSMEEASTQLQATLGLPRTEARGAHGAASRLARPLYLGYRQLDALRTRALYPKPDVADAGDDNAWACAGAEMELRVSTAADELEPVRKRRRVSGAAEDVGSGGLLTARLELAVDAFDWTVEVSGEGDDEANLKATLRLRFSEARKRALLELRVDEGELGGAGGDVFTNLFPGDVGEALEGPGGQALFDYAWVQYLCGLDALPLANAARPSDTVTAEGIAEAVAERLRHRCVAEKVLARLAKKTFPLPVHPSMAAAFPAASADRWVLSTWAEVTPEDGAAAPDPFRYALRMGAAAADGDAGEPNPGGLARERWEFAKCRYFEAVLTRDQASLTALVELSPEYPVRPPRVLLQKRDGGGFDHDLKVVEVEANVYYDELLPEEGAAPPDAQGFLLAHQLRRVQVCLDALTDGKALNSERRGRDRRMALLYRGDEGFEFR